MYLYITKNGTLSPLALADEDKHKEALLFVQ